MEDSYKPVIVIPAYKRTGSLLRLLNSVNEANYPYTDIHLIISIEGDAKKDVISIANDFQFDKGTLEVIQQNEKLGLRKHIMKCADLSEKFGSVLILEDDLVVSPAFYEYACKTLAFYEPDSTIAGISLYSPRFNETALLPFEPLQNEWPVYFMQLGCSWGQTWTRNQWKTFKKWYNKNNEFDFPNKPEIPQNILKWPQSSWKKYFNYFLIDQKKYIVYPYSSFSTNSSEGVGENMREGQNYFHVPLNVSDNLRDFDLPSFSDDSVRYDSFMEAESSLIEKWIGLSIDEVEVDLYGTKPLDLLHSNKYTFTAKKGVNAIRTYPLSFRPIEMNLKYEEKAVDDSFFYLYQTENMKTNEKITDLQYFQLAEYFSYFRIRTKRFAIKYFIDVLKDIMNRTANIFK